MKRYAIFIYGVVAYGLFLVTFLYAIGFVSNLIVPKSIDSGEVVSWKEAIPVNVLLLGLFGVQHSIMARLAFKRHWTKIIPEPAERSTFVLATCIVLGLLFWQWRPMPGVVWDVEVTWLRGVLWGVAAFGWLLVLYSTFLIDHFDLFGLRQVIYHLLDREKHKYEFTERSVYKYVRHPLMLGFLIAFWATPTMTIGHLLFALVVTGYILVALQLEERDLTTILGEEYTRYRERTPMLIPRVTRQSTSQNETNRLVPTHG